MGTDIHGGFIKFTKDVNENIIKKIPVKTNWSMNRDYTLFAILAGIRNGFGVAGHYRHEPLEPITQGRGLPFGLTVQDETCEELYNPWYGTEWGDPDDEEFGCWMGDHSYTYMTCKEILEWKGWDLYLLRGGVVDVEHYKETIQKGLNPDHWCGGISGQEVNVVSQEDYLIESGFMDVDEKHSATHVQCTWQDDQSLRESKQSFLKEVERISNEYGEDTYLVLGFDS